MLDLLHRLNDDGKTVLYVPHDLDLAARAGRWVTSRDGTVFTVPTLAIGVLLTFIQHLLTTKGCKQ